MVSTSSYVADILKAYCGRKSRVIHPVLSDYPQQVSHEKPINDQVTIFTHGRLESGKGLDMLVRVFERMQSTEDKVQSTQTDPSSLNTQYLIPNTEIRLIIF